MSSIVTRIIQQVDDLAEDRVVLNARIRTLEEALRTIADDSFEHAFHAPEKVRCYKRIAREALANESTRRS